MVAEPDSTEADMVVPAFKVSAQLEKEKNSDMGSDCGYFSGSGSKEDPEEETIDFNLQSKVTKPADNSDEEFADFQHQVIDDDFIEEDFDVNYEEEEADAYISSQFDFMYSEDTDRGEPDDE